MLVFRRYWLKLIANFDKICESVKLDGFLRFFVVLIVILFCIDGILLAEWGEVILDLIRADVPFVGHWLIAGAMLCVVAWVYNRSYLFYVILLQLFLVLFFAVWLVSIYDTIQHSPKIVNEQQVREVISADSSYIALILILLGLIVMIGYCANEQMFKFARQIVVGILAIVGILLPDILTSYRVVKVLLSGCVDTSTCGDRGVLSSLSLIEFTLAAAAALAMLLVVSSVLVPLYARFYFRKRADSAAESHAISGNSGNLLKSSDGSVSSVSSVVSDGSAEEVNALEGSSSSPYVVAGSKQLMSAAVGGLVAGACFSVVSLLFGRR